MPEREDPFGNEDFETEYGDVGPDYYDAQDEPIFQGRNPQQVNNEAYRFGLTMANEERYRNRDWEDIEDEVKRAWEQTHPGQEWRANSQEILIGWADGLLGPDPEGAYGTSGTAETGGISPGRHGMTGTDAGFDNTTDHRYGSEEIDLSELNGDAPLGDLGDTVRIVSAEEMEGKIDMHYVDDMDDLSDMPDIDDEGNRGDDIAHLD